MSDLDAIDKRGASFQIIHSDGEFYLQISDRSRECARLLISENQILLMHGETWRAFLESLEWRRYHDSKGTEQ